MIYIVKPSSENPFKAIQLIRSFNYYHNLKKSHRIRFLSSVKLSSCSNSESSPGITCVFCRFLPPASFHPRTVSLTRGQNKHLPCTSGVVAQTDSWTPPSLGVGRRTHGRCNGVTGTGPVQLTGPWKCST